MYTEEGKVLYNLLKGQVYSAVIRQKLNEAGFIRTGKTHYVSKKTAAHYELVLEEKEGTTYVANLDIIEGNSRIHLSECDAHKNVASPQLTLRQQQLQEALAHPDVARFAAERQTTSVFYPLLDDWNQEIDQRTPWGEKLLELTDGHYVTWENLLFLPDPTASGDYLFGKVSNGGEVEATCWLLQPDGGRLMPVSNTPTDAFLSLRTGMMFHRFEFEQFDTAAAAGQYTLKMLNNSHTSYAEAIRRLLHKTSPLSRNDFYRNEQKQMCRVEVLSEADGVRFSDVLALPTVADCIDSLLAPYIKVRLSQAYA